MKKEIEVSHWECARKGCRDDCFRFLGVTCLSKLRNQIKWDSYGLLQKEGRNLNSRLAVLCKNSITPKFSVCASTTSICCSCTAYLQLF